MAKILSVQKNVNTFIVSGMVKEGLKRNNDLKKAIEVLKIAKEDNRIDEDIRNTIEIMHRIFNLKEI